MSTRGCPIGPWASGLCLAAALGLTLATAPASAGKPQYNLTSSHACDTTEGAVESCGYIDPGSGIFQKNNFIEVTAVADWGWQFSHWEGDLAGTVNPTSYRFDDRSYDVHFRAVFVVDGDPGEPPPPDDPPPDPSTLKLNAYFPEWGVWLSRPYYLRYVVETGAADLITHLSYAFVEPGPDPDSGEIVCRFDDPYAAYQQSYTEAMSLDNTADDGSEALRGHFNQLRKLKQHALDDSREIEVLISIGGWLGSTYFSDAALTAESRATFVQSCIDLFIHGNLPTDANGGDGSGVAAGIFSGFDLDWEYPVSGGASGTHHNRNDGANFVALLQEFETQLAPIEAAQDRNIIVTMAGPASDYRAQNFNISDAEPYLDFVQIMTYDLHGSWENRTGHPAEKIVPGGAFYGRGWKRTKSGDGSGLYSRAGGAAPATDEPGYEYYRNLPLDDPGFTAHWDDLAKAPYLYNPETQIFWSYDDPASLAVKGAYVRYHGLGGAMYWEISGDTDGGDLVSALHGAMMAEDPPTSDPCS
jgi:chitinase